MGHSFIVHYLMHELDCPAVKYIILGACSLCILEVVWGEIDIWMLLSLRDSTKVAFFVCKNQEPIFHLLRGEISSCVTRILCALKFQHICFCNTQHNNTRGR